MEDHKLSRRREAAEPPRPRFHVKKENKGPKEPKEPKESKDRDRDRDKDWDRDRDRDRARDRENRSGVDAASEGSTMTSVTQSSDPRRYNYSAGSSWEEYSDNRRYGGYSYYGYSNSGGYGRRAGSKWNADGGSWNNDGAKWQAETSTERNEKRRGDGGWNQSPARSDDYDSIRPVQIVQRATNDQPFTGIKVLGNPATLLGKQGSNALGNSSSRPSPTDTSGVAQSAPSGAATQRKKIPFSFPPEVAPFRRCTLMDEGRRICVGEVHSHLMESASEFTVVAAIGLPGVGKSTVLSMLLSSYCSAQEERKAGDNDNGFAPPLPVQDVDAFIEGRRSPAGVELCVSEIDRLLLLEAQMFAAHEETDGGWPDDYSNLRSEMELLLFVASVSHVLVVVVDTPTDVHLWKILRLLAMVKSKVPDFSAWLDNDSNDPADQSTQGSDILPRLVIVLNQTIEAPPGDDESALLPMKSYLNHTLWKYAPSMHFARVPVLPGPDVKCLLTSAEAVSNGIRLRERILAHGSARGQFGKKGSQMTEREWLYQASNFWDFVKKISVLQEYFNSFQQDAENFGWSKF